MKFYTSDLHLDHKNIIDYEDRPYSNIDSMNEDIIKRWNNKVGPRDIVYILGDFAFCKGPRANNFLDRLNGQKVLVVGNHDSFLDDKSFDRSKFTKICYYDKIHDKDSKGNDYRVILFHYPIAVWDCKHHGAIHLFGHIHKDGDSKHHPLRVKLTNGYNVGVDVNNFEPLTLDEIITKYGYTQIQLT